MSADRFAQAAERLVGTRFRLHGRDPASGLDCIGLFGAALAAIGRPVPIPNGYAMRTRTPESWLPDPASCGFVRASGDPHPGDAVLLRLGVCQVHLAIAGHSGWIHAHAGLRRVVCSPVRPEGTIIEHWRLAPGN